jgi:lysophospholipase L1-like esterase
MELAMAQQPTFVTLWVGNNDILAFATRGGLFPITDVQQFAVDYAAILDNLQAVGAQIVLGNIPDIMSCPFFTTVGPGIGLKLQEIGLPGLVYGKTSGETGVALVNDLFANNVFVLLSGSSAATYIGDQTGAYYTVNGIPVPPGVNTAFPFGLAAENPWPNNLILDPDEIAVATQVVAVYNGIIEGEAVARNFGFADVKTLLSRIATQDGLVINGKTFTSEFITGNSFSLDGVHPTSQGYGIIANEFIKTINTKYGASIPEIDVSTIPGSLNFAPINGYPMGKYGIPNIPHGALDHVIF